MKPSILYVELKQGHSGPAWIGYAHFSKTGNTVYFDDKVLKKGQGISGNHFDVETGEEYWISGVKKNGQDRHWAGGGKIYIDNFVIEDYLKIINAAELPKGKFVITTLNNIPNKGLSKEIENEVFVNRSFDTALVYKKTLKELTDDELEKVMNYYEDIDMHEIHLKARKEYMASLKAARAEMESRFLSKDL